MKPLLILDRISRPLYPAILIVAAVVLLRGHHEPGGGFLAGLLAVTATVLWAVAQGAEAALRRLPLRSPLRLAGAGVLLAAAAGVPGWLAGHAFLTALRAGPLSTTMLFDLGVALSVWGALSGYALPLTQGSDR